MHIVVLILAILAFGCNPHPQAPKLALEPCVLPDTELRAQCGVLEVPEDRSQPDGRRIALNIAVVGALAEEPRPDPLVILVGGPGQSATKSGALMARAFRDVRKRREIVLVDQRGTGKSNPLKCEVDADRPVSEMLQVEFDAQDYRDCLGNLDADPRHYTTPIAMDDLDAVREALGYERINLWGGSYGTRAALVYMRRHPEHVRRVVLDGVAPTDIKLTVHAGRDAQRALDLMFDQCAGQPACARRFGDLRARFQTIQQRLRDSGPREVEFAHPRTGEMETLTMDTDVFAAMVRGVLYAPMLVSTLPLGLEAAERGEWEPLLAALLTIQDNVDADLADGMFLSVVCAEDVPRITPVELERLSDNFLGRTPTDMLMKTCDAWPAANMPDEYFSPITTSHPTLVLSGQLDPVTPPSWGDLVASRLPNAQHVAVEGVAHGVSALPCARSAIAEFLDMDDPKKVDVACSKDVATPLMLSPSGGAP